jgi:hypothetical protein
MTCDSLTGSFYLPACDPALLKRFDAKRPECQLIASLRISLHSALLGSPVFGPFRL